MNHRAKHLRLQSVPFKVSVWTTTHTADPLHYSAAKSVSNKPRKKQFTLGGGNKAIGDSRGCSRVRNLVAPSDESRQIIGYVVESKICIWLIMRKHGVIHRTGST